jgi:histidinol-phosphate/aromatic aminotransferase/cobyric acid decarboxylase-like protein
MRQPAPGDLAVLPDPAPGVAGPAYRVPRHPAPTDLWLDGNEGEPPPRSLLDTLARVGPDALRRYPDPRPLEARVAAGLGVDPARVIVTAGADDALERLCLSVLPGAL